MIPVGPSCLSCARAAKCGYPTYTWTELVTRAKASEAFSDQLLLVKKRLDAKPPPLKEWAGEEVAQGSRIEVRLTKCSIFFTPEDFKSVYQVPLPSDVPLTEVLDETNKPIRGFAVSDPTQPARRLEVSQVLSFSHSKQLAEAVEQARRGQHAELFGKLAGDVVESQGQLHKAMSTSELDALVSRAKEAQVSRDAQREAAQAPPLRAPTTPPRDGAAAAEDDSSPLHLVQAIPALELDVAGPSGKRKAEAERGRGRGRTAAASKARIGSGRGSGSSLSRAAVERLPDAKRRRTSTCGSEVGDKPAL